MNKPPPPPRVEALLAAARQLLDDTRPLTFAPPVTHVYNPLDYAWAGHEAYIRAFGDGRKRIIFLGMNPGPWGMAQTGVPFGEVAAVRDWLKLRCAIGKPNPEHPKRIVRGFDCEQSEVSGRRLWGLFAQRFGKPAAFFENHFVVNYCPLAFMEASCCNRTPDKLPRDEREPLFEACDRHLRAVVDVLAPEWLIGIGAFAEKRARHALAELPIKIARIAHPSPASPAANRNWAGSVTETLRSLGIWK